MQFSPYTPGEVTLFLPGRETHMRRVRSTLHSVADRGEFMARPQIFVGGRGVGKTSLLRYGHDAAQDQGLATVWITAGDAEVLPVLSAEVAKLTSTWRSEAQSEIATLIQNLEFTISAPGFSIKTRVGDPPVNRDAPGRALEELIAATSRALCNSGRGGLAIFIDELQASDKISLRALSYAWQHLRSRRDGGIPSAIFGAGLGHTSDVVTDAATFGERFNFVRLKGLGDEAAYAAIVDPAENLGVKWNSDALDAVLRRAHGYPYFVQLCADSAWEAAGDPDSGGRITLGSVVASEEDVNEQLDFFYRNRWSKASPTERELLRAVAEQPVSTPRRGDVAAALGKSTQAISMARRSLMDKGILDSPARGLLSFTAPGFSEYILEYDGVED